MEVLHSSDGLPVLIWSEGNSLEWHGRSCAIDRDGATGELVFVSIHIEEVGRLYGVMLGVAAGIAIFIVFGLVVTALANAFHIPADERMSVAFLVGVAAAIGGGYVTARRAGPWLAAQGYGTKQVKEAAPWDSLEAFSVSDDQAHFGSPRQKDGKSIEPNPVILAHFGSQRRPMVVSHDKWSGSMVGGMRETLTHEFIERRPEHLKRLASAARAACNEAGVERKKVV